MKESITSPRPEDNPTPPNLGCLTIVVLAGLVVAFALAILLALLSGCSASSTIINPTPQTTPADTTAAESWWF